MRLQLARALMCPADLLLLDEPTNHLDLDALVWLEAWLKRYDGTDARHQPRPRVPRRDHQASHCTWTRRALTRYGGNYTAFEEMRAERMAQQQAAFGAAGQDRPPAALHRPLQGQGQQGQAGAKPRQGAGAHGEAGARC
jgi:ATP-binding cassette subfamily F protein 3